MSALLERLRAALAPRYEVERDLGGGGMGAVFLARDTHLDRWVAVKVLRPEQATAIATDRFVREAHLLARLSHPNIVPVHDADEADGLPYYVMDYVEGETLDARLRRGPLSPSEATKLGRDLLDALEAAHRLGVIHRDIKPSNIFLVGGRALLGDFGVAHSTRDGEALTLPGVAVGTPGYMAPEQSLRGEVSVRTDLYTAGMVLYEALTGRHWEFPADEDEANWSGVPRPLLPVLRRALAWLPEERWPDAATFRRAWWQTRTRPYVRRTIALSALGVTGGLLVASLWFRGPPPVPRPARNQIGIERFAQVGGFARPWLADSIPCYLARGLTGSPDFAVACPVTNPRDGTSEMVLGGTVRSERDSLCIDVESRRAGEAQLLAAGCTEAAAWPVLTADLTSAVLREIWRRNLVPDLPARALPRTRAGFDAWLRAEQLFMRGQWRDAHEAYQVAEALDSTCWLCSWRIHDVQRWLGVPQDPQRTVHYLRYADSFPPHYGTLIRASAVPIERRIDMERAATVRHPQFFFGWWVLGDDLFHRGPLVGAARTQAVEAFDKAASLRPDFAPAWEHLALVYIAEGDRDGASRALARWLETMGGPPRDPFSRLVQALLEAAWAWRFHPGPDAADTVNRLLAIPEVAGSPYLATGPRQLLQLDAPAGAVWLGRRFAEWTGRSHLEQSGLVAQIGGYLALGRPDSALMVLDRLRARRTEPEVRLFAAELSAALWLVDSTAVPSLFRAAERGLVRYATPGAASPDVTRRAAGVLALLRERAGAPGVPSDLSPAFDAMREGLRWARRGAWEQALSRSEAAVRDTTAQLGDPVLRSVLSLYRGEWFGRLGNLEGARRELRLTEHSDVRGYPLGPPQPADVEWALRTLGRWRFATTLDTGEPDEEVCRAYRYVARHWAAGVPVYQARADTARQRLQALGCAPRQ